MDLSFDSISALPISGGESAAEAAAAIGEIPDPWFQNFGGIGGWASTMSLLFPQDEIYNWDVLPWQEWGRQLFNRPSFVNIVVPDPGQYQDWRIWAAALRLATQGGVS